MPSSRQQKVFAIGKLLELCHLKQWDSLNDEREALLFKAAEPWMLDRRTVKVYVERVRGLLAYEKREGKPAVISASLTE
jgi:hypothetical protein